MGNQATQAKLEELKTHGVKLLGMDWDETLHSSKIPQITPRDSIFLLLKAAQKGIISVILTARGVTMEQIFAEEFMNKELHSYASGLDIYIGGCDGRYLSRFRDGKKEEMLYSNFLTDLQISVALDAYKTVFQEEVLPISHGFFQKILSRKWEPSLLDPKVITLAKAYQGNIFIEPAKLTIAGPIDKGRYPAIVARLKKILVTYALEVSWGGKDAFIHIRPKFTEDGKLKALKTIMEKFAISEEYVATFGDAPYGNDQGMLAMKYGFTNDQQYVDSVPPYVLHYTKSSNSVKIVHESIAFLINK